MSKTAAPPAVWDEIEALRRCVIASRTDPAVEADAEKCLGRLRAIHEQDGEAFTAEDVRFVNFLRGTLAVRLEAHRPAGTHARLAKRKGDTLTHCWRCETPVDDRFTAICPDCDSKAYHWRVCPVCRACGCQRNGTAPF